MLLELRGGGLSILCEQEDSTITILYTGEVGLPNKTLFEVRILFIKNKLTITNENLLYSTRNSTQCSVVT